MAFAPAVPFPALNGALERFAKLTTGVTGATGRFGRLLDNTNDRLGDLARSSDATGSTIDKLGRACAGLIARLEGIGGTAERYFGSRSHFGAAARQPAPSAPSAPRPSAPPKSSAPPAKNPPGLWDEIRKFGDPIFGQPDGKDGWVDRGQKWIKFAKTVRPLLGKLPVGATARRWIKSAWTTNMFHTFDKGADMYGDVKNMYGGLGKIFTEPTLAGKADGLVDIVSGFGGLQSDFDDFKSDPSKKGRKFFDRLLNFPKKYARMPKGGSIPRGGLELMKKAAPRAGNWLSRLMSFGGRTAATEGAEVGGTLLEAGAAGGEAVAGGEALAGGAGLLEAGGGAAALAGLEMTPIGWGLTAAAVAGFAGYEAYKHRKQIAQFASNMWQKSAPVRNAAYNALPFIPGGNLVKGAIDSAPALMKAAQPVVNKVKAGAGWVGDFAVGLGDMAWQGLKKGAQGVKTLASSAWHTVSQTAHAAWNTVTTKVGAAWHTVTNRAQAAWKATTTVAANLGHRAADVVKSKWSQATSFFGGLWHSATNAASQVWAKAKPYVDKAGHAVKAMLDKHGVTALAHRVVNTVAAVKNNVVATAVQLGHALNKVAQRGHEIRQGWAKDEAAQKRAANTGAQALKNAQTHARVHAATLRLAHHAVHHHLHPHHHHLGAHAPADMQGLRGRPGGASQGGGGSGYADIRVHFENAPKGTRVSTRTGGCCPPHVETGIAFGN